MTERDQKDAEIARRDGRTAVDDFWDVESLLPHKPVRRQAPPRKGPVETVEVELSAPATAGTPAQAVSAAPLTVRCSYESRSQESRSPEGGQSASVADPATHYVPPHRAPHRTAENGEEKPLLEYQPDGALLHRVRVYGWKANYQYFDQFTKDARRYDAMEPPATATREAFFSYFPQYVQMGRRATAWYLYWRENVRRGQYPDTDYSYVLLYLFELINLPAEDYPTAAAHRDLMARVWMAYRRSYPQLDHYMCEWLCDYCLIHALAAPVDILAPALDDVIVESRLKEFYLAAAVRVSDAPAGGRDTRMETARILLRHCCQYDYRKSKFARGEHEGLFDATIPAAVAHVLPLLLGERGPNAAKPVVTLLASTVTRDAYVGALCSHGNKRRIEVAYTSFSRSHELRFLIGDMVKHVENRLRGWIGVRSRLSVMSLPIPLRDALDAYLAPLEPPRSARPAVVKKEAPRPAYEALYDLPAKTASLADAAAIEERSWETTRILVEAFDGEEPSSGPSVQNGSAEPAGSPAPVGSPVPAAPSQVPTAPVGEAPFPLLPYVPFIRAALDGDTAALRAAAKALGKMPDALADEINALTADGEIGDIILEDDGMGGYAVIEDYREQVTELLHN